MRKEVPQIRKEVVLGPRGEKLSLHGTSLAGPHSGAAQEGQVPLRQPHVLGLAGPYMIPSKASLLLGNRRPGRPDRPTANRSRAWHLLPVVQPILCPSPAYPTEPVRKGCQAGDHTLLRNIKKKCLGKYVSSAPLQPKS